MKTVPPALAAMLASGVTTLCRCWRVERQDGSVFGFTNHDLPIAFDGLQYVADTGFAASESESRIGLAVDTAEVMGVLSSDAISADEIALGLWDAARVTVYLVDWTAPDDRAIETAGVLGELGRGEHVFEVEVRSLAHHLNQETGRTYQRQCDAVLGDARCGVDVDSAAFRGSGAVIQSAADHILTVEGLDNFAADWFSHGTITWTSGANLGAITEIDRHTNGDTTGLVLWQAAARPVVAGDTFIATAGCDKRWSTCRAKFSNGENFRGFPHMPGNDFALSVVKQSNENDGGSFFND